MEVARRGGFASLTDIFQFVISSPYCNSAIYLLENRNATSRVRDSKRKTYMEFLLWLQAQAGNAENAPSYDWTNKDASRTMFLASAQARFPEFLASYQAASYEWKCEQMFRTRFNGQIVSEITGLSGRELGNLIRSIKASFSDGLRFRQWVNASTPQHIREFVHRHDVPPETRPNTMTRSRLG